MNQQLQFITIYLMLNFGYTERQADMVSKACHDEFIAGLDDALYYE